MVRFWSLCRSGLFPVSGRPSLRVFCAALRVCGLPRLRVGVDREGFPSRRRFAFVGLEFFGPTRGVGEYADVLLFRCSFEVRLFV